MTIIYRNYLALMSTFDVWDYFIWVISSSEIYLIIDDDGLKSIILFKKIPHLNKENKNISDTPKMCSEISRNKKIKWSNDWN